MTPDVQRELSDLFDAKKDGELSAEQSRRLAALIRDDEARRFYVRLVQQHTILTWNYGRGTHGIGPLEPVDTGSQVTFELTPPPTADRPPVWKPLLAVAAVLLIAVGWTVVDRRRKAARDDFAVAANADTDNLDSDRPTDADVAPDDKGRVVGRVTGLWAAEARRVSLGGRVNSRTIVRGGPVRTGRHHLPHGIARLRLGDRHDVLIQAPADFTVAGYTEMRLDRGVATVQLTEGKSVLRIETPAIDHIRPEIGPAPVVIGLEVAKNGRSEVHGLSGTAAVRSRLSVRRSTYATVVPGAATRVRNGAQITEGIAAEPDRFLRLTPDASMRNYDRWVASTQPEVYVPMNPASEADSLLGFLDRTPWANPRRIGQIRSGATVRYPMRSGPVGSALHLDGPGDRSYAVVRRYRPSRTGTLSMVAWVRADSRPEWASIAKHWAVQWGELPGESSGVVRRRYAGERPTMGLDPLPDTAPAAGPGGQFHFGLHESSGDLDIEVRDAQGWAVRAREGVPLPIGVWQHVAFTVDGHRVRLYRNGREVASAVCEGLITGGPDTVGLGVKLNPTGTAPDTHEPGFWHGRLDEVCLYHRALTVDEIREHQRRSLGSAERTADSVAMR